MSLKNIIKSFFIQLQFLTRVPIPVKIDYDPVLAAKGMVFAPVTGTILGLIYAAVYMAVDPINVKILPVIFVLFTDLVFTGGLHYDGLADTADGIFSYRDKDRILEIMRDSRIGTNGTLAVVFAVLFKTALLYSIPEKLSLLSIILFPALGRLSICVASSLAGYARKGSGMGECIAKLNGKFEFLLSIIICVIIVSATRVWFMLLLIPCVASSVVIMTLYVKHKISGVTGDVFGAFIELSEIVSLLGIIVLYKTGLI